MAATAKASPLSSARKNAPQALPVGLWFQRFTFSGGVRKISWQEAPVGFLASGLMAARISSGAMQTRDQ